MLIILCMIGLTCIFLPKCQQYRELQLRKSKLEQETGQIETAVKQLQANEERLQTDKVFVERVARGLGMAKPGETVFRVTRETSNTIGGVR